MVREYVGARYVPKFMGPHDLTTEYEALCVVDNGQGTSYISKIPTPAGTPLTNTTYWTVYGAASGAVINLQNQIDEINISKNLQLNKRKFVLVGDSYAHNYTSDGTEIIGWVDRFISVNGLTSDNVTDDHIYRVSGTGFLSPGIKPWKNFIDRTPLDDSVTDVVFVGGCNDNLYANSDPSGLSEAVYETILSAKTKFPNAAIWVGFAGFDLSLTTSTNFIKKCMSIWYRTAMSLGARILSGVECVCYNKNLMLNVSHPNNAGLELLAGAISTALCGGSYLPLLPLANCNVDLNADIANANATQMTPLYVDITDNIMTIKSDPTSREFTVTMNKAINTNPAHSQFGFIIGKSDVIPVGASPISWSFPASAVFSGAGRKDVTVELEIYNGYVSGYVHYIDSNGYLVDTLTYIEAPRFSHQFDLLSGYVV